MSSMRKIIAKAMVNSKHTAPHVTLLDEVDVSGLVAHRKKFKNIALEKDIKLTYLPYVVKALVAHYENSLSSTLRMMKQQRKLFRSIIIILELRQIQSADLSCLLLSMRTVNLSSRFPMKLISLAVKARDGKLSMAEMSGASCSISNIGSAGGQWFTPIINHPEVAILGIGRIAEKPVVKDGEIVAVPMLALSLVFDHRMMDGATAQHALNHLKRLLADPELIINGGVRNGSRRFPD